jgi:hypothetical protein
MNSSDRQAWQAFVQLADTLVAEFDVIDFLHTLAQHCVDLLGVSACGISLADHTGRLNLVAASTEQARLLELSQVQTAEGPTVRGRLPHPRPGQLPQPGDRPRTVAGVRRGRTPRRQV